MVVRSFSAALLSRICRRIATSVAAHKCADRVETIWHTLRTAAQSSLVGLMLRPRSTFSALARPSSWLRRDENVLTGCLSKTAYKTLHTVCLLVVINGIDVAGLKAPSREQLHCGLALEQQLLFGHLHQDETHKFSHVQAADHLLKPDQEKSRVVLQKSHNFYVSWN